ncbi:hypothetical protein COB52_02010 [Candidatus Kaiserbacteria bacterium]|nr:MAG: hypothetical protein COB52_02010 [Candidatus Kaiserbacteria bacterium]
MLTIFADKRVIIVSILLVILLGVFWGTSRYPALNEKSLSDVHINSGLSFNTAIDLTHITSIPLRITYGSINWLNTNKEGMTFGVLLAVLALAILQIIKPTLIQGKFKRSVLGTFIGFPLGVCTNCASPLLKGMYASGMGAQIPLAILFSSPTLNVIALTLLFTFFPLQVALVKVLLTLLLILVILPLSMYLFSETEGNENFKENITESKLDTKKITWYEATTSTGLILYKSLFQVAKIAVPLMVLASILGVTIVELVPMDFFLQLNPTFTSLLLTSIVSTLLPVPMLFDIFAADTLSTAGLPVAFTGTLLFSLGIYSLYATSIIWSTVSRRVALYFLVLIILMGVAAGYITQYTITLNLFGSTSSPSIYRFGLDSVNLNTSEEADVYFKQKKHANRNISNNSGFTRIEGPEIGLSRIFDHGANKRYVEENGIVANDFNRDGWTDVAMLYEEGVAIYINNLGKYFRKIEIPAKGHCGNAPFFIASADIDNDGWVDIFIDTGCNESYFLLNKKGTFNNSVTLHTPPANGAVMSITFGDIDKNGLLDWFLGILQTATENGGFTNRIIMNYGSDRMRTVEKVSKPPVFGTVVSLASILSDIDNDRDLDLIVGNDFKTPDYYYLNTGTSMEEVFSNEGLIPVSALDTMSIDSADIDNDGLVDLFFTGNMRNNRLYKNMGDFKFKDITKSANVTASKGSWSTGASFIDINADGYQDIYVCRSFDSGIRGIQRNQLYINNGDLTFTEQAKEYGLNKTANSIKGREKNIIIIYNRSINCTYISCNSKL